MEIKVSKIKFDEMEAVISTETIPNGYIKGFVTVQGTPYVITGSISKGTGENSQTKFFGNKIVDLRLYDGALKPLNYNECVLAVSNNERERGYNSIKVKYKGIDMVILKERVTFELEKEPEQLNLFK